MLLCFAFHFPVIKLSYIAVTVTAHTAIAVRFQFAVAFLLPPSCQHFNAAVAVP